ncbi:MAG TPA: ABC transporter permease [Stackebrandtia sp.]|jgi:lipooligosaccharide transport system permease protein|uniref:ABC transporter permease n=1 Tax=Stackebrandtia sp. TaxID=2023065 RepID=UPI002D2AA4E2|nr:ABC transporter permease [Stackebrandtia sp.]HZE38199.1 ABC transporter permease [Stackebrandtia sp.]
MVGTFHAFEYWLMNYRRVWYGSVLSTFMLPVLFLVSIGYGVGAYVNNTGALGGVSYAAFVAPGLLASTVLQTVGGEMTWPVFAALRWGQQYKAMQASPLSPPQILAGHLLYGLMRSLIAASVFCGVLGVFGIFSRPTAPLSIVFGLLVGFALIGWIYSFSVTVKNEVALSIIQRFGIVPVSLFSGIFFPLSQLPTYLQPIAWISPVWHGAELCRWAASGTATPWPWPVHVAYLLVLGVLGWWLASARLRRRMTG